MVGWLSDYRIFLFLKGKRLFHTKNTRLFDVNSQENATTIADLYWLSGESPKRDTAASRQWFRAAHRALAAGLPCRVERVSRCALTADRCQITSRRANPCTGCKPDALAAPPLAWSALCCTVWHGSITGGAPLHPYIPYYNRRLVWLLYCVRWNRSNQRERHCKAL